ncbi:MAG: hypothetical protein ABSA13_09305 [Beijerinckiaceae bacterium]
MTRFGFARLPAAILVAASLSPFWPVSSFAAAPNGWEKMTFTEKMSVLHDELRGLMDLEAIPSAHSYKILSAEARQNIDDCLRYLADPGHDGEDKDFAIVTMDNLDLADYVRFVRGAISLAQRGLIAAHQLQLIASPPYDCNDTLLINYQDKTVRELLESIKSLPDTSAEYKTHIDDMLSGKALDDAIQYKRECCDEDVRWLALPSENPQTAGYPATYAGKIAAIDAAENRVVADYTLLGFKPFDDLSNEGVKNLDDCLEFLAKGGQIRQQRQIAILSMHELALTDYIRFMRELIALNRRGLVTQMELYLAIDPGINFTDVFYKHFENKDIEPLFRTVFEHPDAPEDMKARIDEIFANKELQEKAASTQKRKLLMPPD